MPHKTYRLSLRGTSELLRQERRGDKVRNGTVESQDSDAVNETGLDGVQRREAANESTATTQNQTSGRATAASQQADSTPTHPKNSTPDLIADTPDTPVPAPRGLQPVYGNVNDKNPVSKPITIKDLEGYVQTNTATGGFAKEYEVFF